MIVVSPARGAGVTSTPTAIVLFEAEYSKARRPRITLDNAGAATGADTAVSGPLTYTWCSATPSDYEVYCQVVSGSVDGARTGQWLSLGTTRYWENKDNDSSAVVTLTIRDAATLTTQASETVTLTDA